MVPVQSPQGELLPAPRHDGDSRRRGRSQLLKARALLLEPEHPFFVADRVVSRAGVQADRYFRCTRSSDGTIFVWLARKSGPGRGPGWSGLRFDIVRHMTSAAGQ